MPGGTLGGTYWLVRVSTYCMLYFVYAYLGRLAHYLNSESIHIHDLCKKKHEEKSSRTHYMEYMVAAFYKPDSSIADILGFCRSRESTCCPTNHQQDRACFSPLLRQTAAKLNFYILNPGTHTGIKLPCIHFIEHL